jgi:hypothetical protein
MFTISPATVPSRAHLRWLELLSVSVPTALLTSLWCRPPHAQRASRQNRTVTGGRSTALQA